MQRVPEVRKGQPCESAQRHRQVDSSDANTAVRLSTSAAAFSIGVYTTTRSLSACRKIPACSCVERSCVELVMFLWYAIQVAFPI